MTLQICQKSRMANDFSLLSHRQTFSGSGSKYGDVTAVTIRTLNCLVRFNSPFKIVIHFLDFGASVHKSNFREKMTQFSLFRSKPRQKTSLIRRHHIYYGRNEPYIKRLPWLLSLKRLSLHYRWILSSNVNWVETLWKKGKKVFYQTMRNWVTVIDLMWLLIKTLSEKKPLFYLSHS